MAENKQELVDLYVPKASNSEDPNFYISINFKSWLLPRGKTSKVPQAVADEYYRSLRATEKYDESVDRLKEMANKGV